jgi:hypothetical protein
MLYINQDGRGNSYQLENNSWYWNYYSCDYPYAIAFSVIDEIGTIYIEYNQLLGDYPYYSVNCGGSISSLIYPNNPLNIRTSSVGGGGCIFLQNCSTTIYGLTIRFVPGDFTTTSSTTTTLYPIPENPEIFLHVGNINVSGESCGNYKYTLEGADSNYFSLYGKRIYLTKYPSITKTYNVNICAKDLANRFTPVCDTFSLTVNKCEFTTEPPTTTPAPNFGFVQQENNVTPVNQYTYNKIYSVRKYK